MTGADPGSAGGTSSDSGVDPTGSDDPGAAFKFDVPRDDIGLGATAPAFPETCEQAAVLTTSVGCEFYPLVLPGSETSGFAVSNVSNEVATVVLSSDRGRVDSAQVLPGGTYLFQVSQADGDSAETRVSTDGYVIESDQVLQVYQHMPPEGTVTADASIVLPGPALGTRHRLVAYNSTTNNRRQYVKVVATADDTQVTFTLTQPDSQALAGGGFPALDHNAGRVTLTATIDRLETFMVAGEHLNDSNDALNEFTGALLESDKPVAVYSGKALVSVPGGECCGDLIATSVPPTRIYGLQYAGVRLLPVGLADKYDIWRVIANEDDTRVELTGDYEDTLELDAGDFADVATPQVFWAAGNRPFAMVHFMTAGSLLSLGKGEFLEPHDCTTPVSSPGDPAMVWTYPAGNWLSRYQFAPGAGSSDWCHDHVTIVSALDTWDQLTMDGRPLPEPTPIGGDSRHGYVYRPVANIRHEVRGPENVGIEVSVYGYVSHGSYLFPGGVGLRTLNPAG